MPVILKGLLMKTNSALLCIATITSLLTGCNKNAETASIKIIGETTIVHGIDPVSVLEKYF
jgi:hypothetical protein